MPGVRRSPLVRFITMGCAKNEVDTDNMCAALEASGFSVEKAPAVGDFDPFESDPDVVVVNTCSFITEATQESVDAVLAVVAGREDLAEASDGNYEGPAIVVTGCMPSRYGKDLAEQIPEVDAFVNVKDETGIVEVVCDVVSRRRGSLAEEAEGSAGYRANAEPAGLAGPEGTQGDASVRDGAGAPGHSDADTFGGMDAGIKSRTGDQQPFAYVKISDGCNRMCSFCTIPFIRGRYESRPPQEIISEVGYLVSRGVREIVLIGQDTGVWGDDLSSSESFPLPSPTLANLMGYLAEKFPTTWFRVMYLQPERVSDELLITMRDHENICNYLDVPLQHCSAEVIANMNRKGSGPEYLKMLEHARETVPGITLRTTMISGFPGETDEQAAELVEFLDEADFDFAGVFVYSREDGTVAGNRTDQVPEEVALERAQEARDMAEACGERRAFERVGKVYDVLVCGFDEDADVESDLGDDQQDGEPNANAWGRAMFQAPDVDSVITFSAPRSSLGEIVPVKITGAIGYDLEGEIQR
ncbi:MAG: 30S ribosomal protein S12 methylthiotransferase RimO [Coriobacteriales bacterium]|jgi:ribosomal protein S12 methylthiotransferase